MAQRINLANAVAIGAAARPGIRVRLADPPFSFVGAGGYTGNVDIQESVDDDSVADADATWFTIGTVASGAQLTWGQPLFRVRADPSSTTGTGSVTVQMLEGVRSLKNERSGRNRKPTARQTREART
jgi:hypothetical protein